MHPMTQEWVDKAESDYAVVSLLVRASRTTPLWEPICFHAQQCIEKYLKARLVEANIPFPKTHDLDELLKLVVPVEPAWAAAASPFPRMAVWAAAHPLPRPHGDPNRSGGGGGPDVPAMAATRPTLPRPAGLTTGTADITVIYHLTADDGGFDRRPHRV